jgi:hypothetical protein
MGSGGLVVRVGDTVRRPQRLHSPAVRAFLRHLDACGFDGAPRFLGTDERGREILSWIDGDVGLPPFPPWVATDELLVSVAHLQRRLHEAARGFVPPPEAVWDRANLPDAPADAIVCHNDLCVENVVVRAGQAVAFIDFDFAAPNDPLVDIAIALRHWVPVWDPADLTDGRAGADQIARFGRFCDVHGLERVQRRRVVGALGDFLDRALESMRSRAAAGLPLYRRVWDAGYPGRNRRARAWLDAHATELAAS